jgi:hypothetical protein
VARRRTTCACFVEIEAIVLIEAVDYLSKAELLDDLADAW